MFSIVIPTIWSIPHYTLELVKNLVNCELIDDIIIVDNMSNKYVHKKIYDDSKVTRIVMDSNIFVNPAWNLGVSSAKNEHIIICNDDVIIEPTKTLELLLKKSNTWDAAGLGPDAYEHNTGSNINLSDVTKRTFGWGCFMAVKKSKWVNIPSDIKIFYGDDFIIRTNERVKNINVPFKVKTKMSSSSLEFHREYMVKDGKLYSKIDFSKYNTFNEGIENKPSNVKLKPLVKKEKVKDHVMISMIMMSNLSDYENSRSNAVVKFKRAVNSFINQKSKRTDIELVIVSDGCDVTDEIFESEYLNIQNVRLIKSEKSNSKWPGAKRQLGIDNAYGDWIGYLDTDDILREDHAYNILSNIDDEYQVMLSTLKSTATCVCDERSYRYKSGNIVFKNSQNMWLGLDKYAQRSKESYLFENKSLYLYKTTDIRTKFTASSIFHKREIDIKWEDRDNRGEDILFANKLIEQLPYKKVQIPSYVICHVPKVIDV